MKKATTLLLLIIALLSACSEEERFEPEPLTVEEMTFIQNSLDDHFNQLNNTEISNVKEKYNSVDLFIQNGTAAEKGLFMKKNSFSLDLLRKLQQTSLGAFELYSTDKSKIKIPANGSVDPSCATDCRVASYELWLEVFNSYKDAKQGEKYADLKASWYYKNCMLSCNE
ncbi:hypothetical protein [Fulvivirga ligni]|uniref:hypothetical protein n=1 Tax=Fulvivirga ligni TaxID=2904246 RepID=UPI001F22C4E2|nr:hypothetical protein [Fulvivirga ligni]UII21288.1 hypothetical protein LVD16_26000 [Fulvivirga ligni]